jgi:hypothetical protein
MLLTWFASIGLAVVTLLLPGVRLDLDRGSGWGEVSGVDRVAGCQRRAQGCRFRDVRSVTVATASAGALALRPEPPNRLDGQCASQPATVSARAQLRSI